MYYFNLPVYKPYSFYTAVIDKIIDSYSQKKEIISIYQIGSIGDPGISDLDIILVFKDGLKYFENPLDILLKDEKYLFTHSIFGISQSNFIKNLYFSLYTNYKLLYGEELVNTKVEANNVIKNELSKQIALEFIVANILAREIEKKYGIISVRNLLLSAKAIKYDLELLDITHKEPLVNNINELILIRKKWFLDTKKSLEKFKDWNNDFYKKLKNFSYLIFSHNSLCLPIEAQYVSRKNINFFFNHHFEIKSSGFAVPTRIIKINSKLKKINKYLTKFTLFLPVKNDCDIYFQKRLEFTKTLFLYNKEYLPEFAGLANPFLYQISEGY